MHGNDIWLPGLHPHQHLHLHLPDYALHPHSSLPALTRAAALQHTFGFLQSPGYPLASLCKGP